MESRQVHLVHLWTVSRRVCLVTKKVKTLSWLIKISLSLFFSTPARCSHCNGGQNQHMPDLAGIMLCFESCFIVFLRAPNNEWTTGQPTQAATENSIHNYGAKQNDLGLKIVTWWRWSLLRNVLLVNVVFFTWNLIVILEKSITQVQIRRVWGKGKVNSWGF